MEGVNYSSEAVPEAYKCEKCGAHGVKLWREYQTCAPSLFCRACAETAQRWTHTWTEGDSIGGLVPAVPDEEGVGYWGYTSVPTAGCRWWHKLEPKAEGPRYADITADDDTWVASLCQAYMDVLRYENGYLERLMWRSYADEAARLGVEVNPHVAKAALARLERLDAARASAQQRDDA